MIQSHQLCDNLAQRVAFHAQTGSVGFIPISSPANDSVSVQEESPFRASRVGNVQPRTLFYRGCRARPISPPSATSTPLPVFHASFAQYKLVKLFGASNECNSSSSTASFSVSSRWATYKRYWAVAVGRAVGVYDRERNADRQTLGFPGADCKVFMDKEEAYRYVNDRRRASASSGLA